jgi:predicted ATPase/signal transduction histidine kinase
MTLSIGGYLAQELIYESQNSFVYRGRRGAQDRPVVLKMLKQAYPSPEKVAWFQREYELTRSLHLEGVIKTYELTTDQHRPIMVLEDFGGESLELHLKRRQQRFTLAEFLPLAIQIADILDQVHQQHVMHKDVNPANIVWNPHTDQIKLIDFGISTALTRENPVPRNPTGGEGTLAYISPEQTGRMNRGLDYRTDLYSLGVTFYELLTGQLPFPITDALALMYAHLARQPTPPEKLVPDLPQPLSAIVLKLMAKNAEDRYQSAHGLKADLEECLRQWRTVRRIDPFPLRRQDSVDRFHLPQKLYGREAEVATLLTAFERVSQGTGELMLVSGSAGIGKSALAREVYKSITRQRGYFIAGKFEQFHKNIPYAPLTQAFRSLMRQLLTESAAQIAVWREKLLSALGPNGRVIIDIVPEVALIIGPQLPVPALPPVEAQNRLHLVFQNFAWVFAQADHPLVLFLDDLQWADTASLNLVSALIARSNDQYLFVIGAYRDNEVYEAHPLMLTLDEVQKTGSTVHRIVLQPLGFANVCQLLVETLNCTLERTKPLADLVLTKTNGNPFFINEFLKSLYTEELLRFDFQSGRWRWDIGKIQARNITDNVVELMSDKLQKLTPRTQQVLRLAACIGNQFDLRTLAIVHQRPARETVNDLWEALEESLISPVGNPYKLMAVEVQGLAEEMTVEYRFAHDRIQQAAYSLIPEWEKEIVHHQIGWLLLQRLSADEREQRIFDIVNHLNLGRNLIHSQTKREELAELNLSAGKKAKAAAAPKAALSYLQAGLDLLGEDAWETQYRLALALHEEAAEAAYLSNEYEQMERLTEAVLQHAKTFLDKVRVYEFNIEAGHTGRRSIMKGINVGLTVLEQLGVSLPRQPNQADIMQGLEELRQVLAGKGIESLLDLPEMTDLHKLAAMSVLMRLSTPAYMGVPELFPLINFSAVSLSVKYGNTLLSTRAYAACGGILCGGVGNINAGYQFGELALTLVERFTAPTVKANVIYLVNGFIRHWKEHVRKAFTPLLEAYRISLETGAFGCAAMSTFSYVSKAYWSGQELAGLEREMAKYGDAIGRLKQEIALNLNKLFRQAVLNLVGKAESPCYLIGESYNEAEILPRLHEANNVNALCMLYLHKLTLCYLFHNYPQAVAHADMANKYLRGAQGGSAIPVVHLYDSLARLAVFSESSESERKNILEKITGNQEKMQLWAQHAPMNYLHKFYLVEAERARVLGNDGEAREYYDKAITLAQEHEYLNEEALAYELAGRFYLARGQPHLARYYLHDAHYAYLRWGAVAKVRDLEARYPQGFLTQITPTLQQVTSSTSTAHTEQHLSSALDVTSVLKASQAITSEIVLDRLLTTLMKIAIENAGAQRGFLILEKEGQLMIEAEGTTDENDVAVLQSIPIETRRDLPITIVRYVERKKETVVLSDATQEDVFAADPYITEIRPKSILCTPLVKQGQLIGIVCLENNLTTGAFTPDRVEIVNLLSAEAAISIDNARLYRSLEAANERLADYSRNLEQKVDERTQALAEKNWELEMANQQIVEATRRKSQFLAGMSHQLRTPMNAIIGFTRLVLRRTGEVLPERQRDNLVKVKESADHLLNLINDLLDLSKIEAGRMEVRPVSFDVNRFIQACCETVSPLVGSGVQLRHEVSDEVGEAYTDEDGLRQIVLNLLSNAIKFTEAGEVMIKVRMKAQTDGDAALAIAVADTGVGIAAEALEDIFEEFKQLPRDAQEHQGTGLGLPIAKRWAELLRGSITVESELGTGSTFTVTVPIVYGKQ